MKMEDASADSVTPQVSRLCSGGPFDLMSRRVVAANNRTIAERIVKEIHAYTPARDDAAALRGADL